MGDCPYIDNVHAPISRVKEWCSMINDSNDKINSLQSKLAKSRRKMKSTEPQKTQSVKKVETKEPLTRLQPKFSYSNVIQRLYGDGESLQSGYPRLIEKDPWKDLQDDEISDFSQMKNLWINSATARRMPNAESKYNNTP